MSEIAACNPTPWYHHHLFAVLPNWSYWEGNEQNCSSFKFHWLVFRMWSMSSPDFGFEASFSQAQIQLRIRLPYLITGLFIPVMPWEWEYKLWRKSRGGN